MYRKSQKIVQVGKFIATLFYDGRAPVWDEYESETAATVAFTNIHRAFCRDEVASHKDHARAGVIAEMYNEFIIVNATAENDFQKLLRTPAEGTEPIL